MGNELRYKPAAMRQIDTRGPSFHPGTSAWAGVQKAAEGAMKAVTAVDAFLDHMDEVEDENAMYGMLADIDTQVAEASVAYETEGADINNYSKDQSKIFSDITERVTSSYQFKRENMQTAYNKALLERQTNHTLAAKKRELVLRTQRATAQWNDNNQKDLMAATSMPDFAEGRDFYIMQMAERGEKAVKNGYATPETLRAATDKGLNEYDWYEVNQQIEANPQKMVTLLSDYEKTHKVFPSLMPNQVNKGLQLAQAEVKKQNKHNTLKKAEAQAAWSKEWFKLLEEKEDKDLTADEIKAIEDRQRNHIHAGAGVKGDAFLMGLLKNLGNPKRSPTDPGTLAKLQQGVTTGKLMNPAIWQELANREVISPSESKALDALHEKYLKNHGQINQWDGEGGIYAMAKAYAGGKDDNDAYFMFINTMHHVQKETGYPNYHPYLRSTAEKLRASLKLDNIPVDPTAENASMAGWGKTRKLSQVLQHEKPWSPEAGDWQYDKEFDFRIPTASKEEIDFVHKKWEEVANQQRREGKPVSPLTATNLQLILERYRGNI